MTDLPEGGPERRAAITAAISSQTGIDEPMIERLVKTFYARIQVHPVLGPDRQTLEVPAPDERLPRLRLGPATGAAGRLGDRQAGGADGMDQGGSQLGHGIDSPRHRPPPFGGRPYHDEAPPMSLRYPLPMSLHRTLAHPCPGLIPRVGKPPVPPASMVMLASVGPGLLCRIPPATVFVPPTQPSPTRGEGFFDSLPPCGGGLGWGVEKPGQCEVAAARPR